MVGLFIIVSQLIQKLLGQLMKYMLGGSREVH